MVDFCTESKLLDLETLIFDQNESKNQTLKWSNFDSAFIKGVFFKTQIPKNKRK